MECQPKGFERGSCDQLYEIAEGPRSLFFGAQVTIRYTWCVEGGDHSVPLATKNRRAASMLLMWFPLNVRESQLLNMLVVGESF